MQSREHIACYDEKGKLRREKKQGRTKWSKYDEDDEDDEDEGDMQLSNISITINVLPSLPGRDLR